MSCKTQQHLTLNLTIPRPYLCILVISVTHHVPYSQNDGARSYMAAEAAARRVPPLPRQNHLCSFWKKDFLVHECWTKMNNVEVKQLDRNNSCPAYLRVRTVTYTVCLNRCLSEWTDREPLIWLIPESRDRGRHTEQLSWLRRVREFKLSEIMFNFSRCSCLKRSTRLKQVLVVACGQIKVIFDN